MPTSSDPARPGPYVTATASTSGIVTPAAPSASSRAGTIQRRWARAATSGTIPPVGAWSAIWLATTFAWMRRPSSTSATPVSSQLDSIAQDQRPAHAAPSPSDPGPVSGSTAGGGYASSAVRRAATRSTISTEASGSVVMISASSWLSL